MSPTLTTGSPMTRQSRQASSSSTAFLSLSLSPSSIHRPHHQEPILSALQKNENNLEKQEIVDFVKQLCAALGQLIPGFEVIFISPRFDVNLIIANISTIDDSNCFLFSCHQLFSPPLKLLSLSSSLQCIVIIVIFVTIAIIVIYSGHL